METYGQTNCFVKFKNQVESMSLYIVPDRSMLPKMILGRDFLDKFQIYLTKRRLLYTKEKLKQLNKDMSSEMLKRTHFCALNPTELNIVNKFDLLKPSKSTSPSSESHCSQPNSVFSNESEYDEG